MRLLLILLLATFMALPAQAAFEGPGSPNQTGAGAADKSRTQTVRQALAMPDDAHVVLTGKIVEQIVGSDDDYIFRDETGQIRVDIDKELFQGRQVTPANVVRISGEIDKDMGKAAEVDVKSLEILQ